MDPHTPKSLIIIEEQPNSTSEILQGPLLRVGNGEAEKPGISTMTPVGLGKSTEYQLCNEDAGLQCWVPPLTAKGHNPLNCEI